MEFLFPVLIFVGVLGVEPTLGSPRESELYTALDRAVVLHEASRTHDAAAPTADQAMSLDLMYMELDSGYLAKACVSDDETVGRMRLMIAYVGLLRLLGESDHAIKARLIEAADTDSDDVARLLDFAGLDGIGHFICQDYMHEALANGMSEQEMRAYIDDLDPPPYAIKRASGRIGRAGTRTDSPE